MKELKHYKGIVALLDRINVDTDQIIPKQFLKAIGKTGFGKHLFFDWRYLDDGSPNPEFELNAPRFKGAGILLAGKNFGCGSSREHAPWSLLDYGFRVIISESFADIFQNNCYKNGILPIVISAENYQKLKAEFAETSDPVEFEVDVEKQELKTPGGLSINFDVDPFRKEFLIQGMDDIDWTLRFEKEIENFERKDAYEKPWAWEI